MGKIIKNGIEYGGGGGGSGTGGHTIVDTDGSPVADEPKLQFTGLDVQDNSTDSETEVSAFGLNADSLDDIIDSANIPANPMVTNGFVYSTAEQVVGKWIDGKPIYQRTVVVTSNFTSNTTIPCNAESLVSFDTTKKEAGSGTSTYETGNIYDSPNDFFFGYGGVGENGGLYMRAITTSAHLPYLREVRYTIRYTKTS